MIVDEVELRCSITWMARMYVSQDREAVEPVWDPDTRQMMAEQTQNVRLGIEREVAEYLAIKYGYAQKPVSAMPQAAVLTEQAA